MPDQVRHDERGISSRNDSGRQEGDEIPEQVRNDGRMISGVRMVCGVGNGLLSGFGGKDVFEGSSGFREGDTQ